MCDNRCLGFDNRVTPNRQTLALNRDLAFCNLNAYCIRVCRQERAITAFGIHNAISRGGQTLRPNFFSSSAFEIWIMVGRPWGQQ